MHYDSPSNEYVLFLSNQIKNGPPDRAVTTPIGISSGASANLATTSAQIMNIAPKNRLMTNTFLWSEPTSNREICGIIKPTKPMAPLTATNTPVNKETTTISTF